MRHWAQTKGSTRRRDAQLFPGSRQERELGGKRGEPPLSHRLLHPRRDSNGLSRRPSEREGRSQQINGFSGQRCIKVQPHSGQELSIPGETQKKSCPRDRTTRWCWDQLYKTIKIWGSWWLSQVSQRRTAVTPCRARTGRAQARSRPAGRRQPKGNGEVGAKSRRDGTPGSHSSEDFCVSAPERSFRAREGPGRPLPKWARPDEPQSTDTEPQGTDTVVPGPAAGSAHRGRQPRQTGSLPTGSARSYLVPGGRGWSRFCPPLRCRQPQQEGAESRAG